MRGSAVPDNWLFRLVSRLLRRWLGDRDYAAVISELGELYELRRRRGDSSPDRWLYRQLLIYPWYLLRERRRSPPAASGSRPALNHTPDSRQPMQTLLQDLRHSLRSLLRTPVVSAVVIFTIGLAIGANTAIFSLLEGVLLNPLSYPEPQQLVRIFTQPASEPERRWPLSVVDYQALDRRQAVFSQFAGFGNTIATFNRGEIAERIPGRQVTWRYFALLGVPALHGRLFVEADDQPGAEPTVVVSHSFWLRYLGGDRAAVGETVRLDGVEYRVIGVLPARVGALEENRDFFAAAGWDTPSRKGPFFVHGLGRIKPGLSREAVRAQLLAINQQLFPVWQSSFQQRDALWGMEDLQKSLTGEIESTLYLAFGAVLFVFLIASANAANLLIARSSYRRRELAVRSALGASRARLLLHLLNESLVLAGAASLLALGLAYAGVLLFRALGSSFVPRSQEIGLSGPVLWFLFVASLIALVLFGLLPSLGLADPRIQPCFGSDSRSATTSSRLQRLRRSLVMAEVAVAVPLLIGGGLLVASLNRLQQVDLGFDPAPILTLEVSLPNSYRDGDALASFWRRALEEVRALPGVDQVSYSDSRPPSEIRQSNNFDLLDKPTPVGKVQPEAAWISITREYFATLQIPLLQGRLLEEIDEVSAANVVVVDQAWANRFFPGEEVIGRRFYSGGCTTCEPTTVVGVVGTVKFRGLDRTDQGTIYSPALPSPPPWGFLLVRTRNEPLRFLPAIRRVMREIDPLLPVSRVATAPELVEEALQSPRYLTSLVASFAGTSLLLTLVGIYGVVLFFVQQQTRDIGIRVAIGATPADIVGLVSRNALRLVGGGILAGLLLAFLLTRFMASLLFQVSPYDPFVFGLAGGLILVTALLASGLPAWRATRLDPVRALRIEGV